MTKETKQKAKDVAKSTVTDKWLIALTLETMANYLFDYWSLIAPYLGEHEAWVRIPAFAVRFIIVGWRFYRNNKGK